MAPPNDVVSPLPFPAGPFRRPAAKCWLLRGGGAKTRCEHRPSCRSIRLIQLVLRWVTWILHRDLSISRTVAFRPCSPVTSSEPTHEITGSRPPNTSRVRKSNSIFGIQIRLKHEIRPEHRNQNRYWYRKKIYVSRGLLWFNRDFE